MNNHNALKAIRYLEGWILQNKHRCDSNYYEYLNDLADRVEEMLDIYHEGGLTTVSTDTYLANYQKDFLKQCI